MSKTVTLIIQNPPYHADNKAWHTLRFVGAALVKSLADGKMIRLAVIDGADHAFLDLYAEDLYGAVIPFIAAP